METFDFTKTDNEYMYNMGSNMLYAGQIIIRLNTTK